MSEGKIVVCPQCGKKYKLKAGFDAASFSCKQCSATVRVKPKSSASPTPGRRRRGAGASSAPAASARRGRRAAGRSPAKPRTGRAAGATRPGRAGRRGRAAAADPPEEGEERRSRYQKKESSATLLLAIAGVVLVAGMIIFFATRGGKQEETAKIPAAPVGEDQPESGSAAATQVGDAAGKPAPAGEQSGNATQPPSGATDSDEKPAPGQKPETSAGTDGGAKRASSGPTRKLGGKRGKKSRNKGRFDPPADLGHLESTPPDMRKKIDDLITTMMDFEAGRDSLDAKDTLIAIGKPAFPRILGAMAKIRDTITDVDSLDERMIESSLKLADECLREMDGWLTAKQKSTLRPGSEKRYIAYICRLHYKRWVQELKEMPEMPGPFDPSGTYEGEAEEYGGK